MNERMLQPFFSDDLTDIMNWPFSNWALTRKTPGTPGLTVWEEENDIVVEAPLPGIQPDQVHLTFEKGILTIQASRKEEREDKERKYYQRSDSSFQYAVRVPGEVDEGTEPTAKLKDGVLHVRFKKHKRSIPKRISVQTS